MISDVITVTSRVVHTQLAENNTVSKWKEDPIYYRLKTNLQLRSQTNGRRSPRRRTQVETLTARMDAIKKQNIERGDVWPKKRHAPLSCCSLYPRTEATLMKTEI